MAPDLRVQSINPERLPWRRRARPSATLDKKSVFSCGDGLYQKREWLCKSVVKGRVGQWAESVQRVECVKWVEQAGAAAIVGTRGVW